MEVTAYFQRSDDDRRSASKGDLLDVNSVNGDPLVQDEMMLNKDIEMVCKICLEKHESWQMLRNSTCAHSFCYDCMTQYATTKMQENNKTIACPEINCTSTLDLNTLRLLIPRETLTKWDAFLCESAILDSQKLYCPFTNCSVLLIHDDTSACSVTRTGCPVCRRSFCAVCRVPWHTEFSCKEFGKLKKKKEDKLAVALAKKKKWKKCPNCNFFVEKAAGCMHMTCRCKYEFCYKCGTKWGRTHYECREGQSKWLCRVRSTISAARNIF